MTNAQRMTLKRIRVIKIQWLIIFCLAVALIISIATRPKTAQTVEVPASPATEEPTLDDDKLIEAETQSAVTQSIVTAEPTQLLAVSAADEETEADTLIKLGEFKVTAYCPCVKCCGIWSEQHPSRIGTDYIQKTRGGTIPQAGRTVAVDPNVIPLGTVIIIDGHEYIAEDTGGAVNQRVIDIFFDSHEDALNWGVKYKTIYIKGEEQNGNSDYNR